MQAKFLCTVCIRRPVAGISASTVYCTGASICGALKGGSRCCFFNSGWGFQFHKNIGQDLPPPPPPPPTTDLPLAGPDQARSLRLSPRRHCLGRRDPRRLFLFSTWFVGSPPPPPPLPLRKAHQPHQGGPGHRTHTAHRTPLPFLNRGTGTTGTGSREPRAKFETSAGAFRSPAQGCPPPSARVFLVRAHSTPAGCLLACCN
jgi:hypothetical protein